MLAMGPRCDRCNAALPPEARFCAQCGWRIGPLHLSWARARYWRVLLFGLALYVVAGNGLRVTGNIHLLPTLLLLGSFLIPVTFVTFLYENEAFSQLPVTTVTAAFFLGGVLGTVAASELEAPVGAVSGVLLLVAVGFIEEVAKLLGVVWWLRRPELRSEGQGLVLGAAAGMGFAALETMGYGLIAFAQNPNLHTLATVLAARGLLSPLAHGTWTAILASVIWRERWAGRPVLGGPVLRTYVFVSVLHSLWDLTGILPQVSLVLPFVAIPLPTLVIGLVGLGALHARMVESRRQWERS